MWDEVGIGEAASLNAPQGQKGHGVPTPPQPSAAQPELDIRQVLQEAKGKGIWVLVRRWGRHRWGWVELGLKEREKEKRVGTFLGRKWENWVRVNVSKSVAWKFFLIRRLFCGSF